MVIKVEIYTKKDCNPCAQAKIVLDQKGIKYQAYEIGKEVSVMSIQKLFPNSKTVPIFTIDGMVMNNLGEVLKVVDEHGE